MDRRLLGLFFALLALAVVFAVNVSTIDRFDDLDFSDVPSVDDQRQENLPRRSPENPTTETESPGPSESDSVQSIGRSILCQVYKTDGNPIKGAEVRWRPAPIGEEEELQVKGLSKGWRQVDQKTNHEGEVSIVHAPHVTVELTVMCDGYWAARRRYVDVINSKEVVVLEEAPTVYGEVVAAESGKKISDFRIDVELKGLRTEEIQPKILYGKDAAEHLGISLGENAYAIPLIPRSSVKFFVTGPSDRIVAKVALAHLNSGTRRFCRVKLQRATTHRGHVVDADGDPIHGALIDVASKDYGADLRFKASKRCRTQADGSFVLTGYPEGLYALDVSHPDFLVRRGISIRLSHDQQDQPTRIQLERGARLQGVVREADGKPAKGVFVYAAKVLETPRENPLGRQRQELITILDEMMPKDSVTTDDQGRYLFRALPEGEYLVNAISKVRLGEPSDHGRSASEAIRNGEKLSLHKYQTVTQDFDLPCLTQLRGLVVSGNQPIQGALVYECTSVASEDEPRYSTGVKTNTKGQFALSNIPTGTALIGVRFERSSFVALKEVEVNTDSSQQLVFEVPTSSISGCIRDQKGEPLAGYKVIARPFLKDAKKRRKRMESTEFGYKSPSFPEWSHRWDRSLDEVVTDKNGRFRINHVPSGSVELLSWRRETKDEHQRGRWRWASRGYGRNLIPLCRKIHVPPATDLIDVNLVRKKRAYLTVEFQSIEGEMPFAEVYVENDAGLVIHRSANPFENFSPDVDFSQDGRKQTRIIGVGHVEVGHYTVVLQQWEKSTDKKVVHKKTVTITEKPDHQKVILD